MLPFVTLDGCPIVPQLPQIYEFGNCMAGLVKELFSVVCAVEREEAFPGGFLVSLLEGF